MNASSTVNRIAAASTERERRVVAVAAQEVAAGPEAQRRNAIAPQQPVEDRRGADRVAYDARLVADAQHHDAGEDRRQRAQERDRPLQRDPGGAERHQRKRNGEPALFQRKGQCQRHRCERAGGVQRDRGLQAGPVLALAQDFGCGSERGREQHGQNRKRDRAIEMRDPGVERDQQRQRREDGRGRPDHRNLRRCSSGPVPEIR